MNETLQVIVTILGVLSQVILLGRQFYGKESSEKEAVSGTKQNANIDTSSLHRIESRSLLDLSFVLICSAFFALLLTDSLIISGRNPSPGPSTIITVFLITAVVLVTMCGAWFLGVTEVVTAFLAITTFIVLIISRGGPFFASETDSVAALSLLVPVVALVTLASAMFIYAFGNPLSRSVSKRNRLTISLALIGLVFISGGALGKQLVQDVANNERSPKISSRAAKELLQKVTAGNLQQRREFYRLASEVSLNHVYSAYYREVAAAQRSVLTDAQQRSADAAPSTPSPTPLASTANPGSVPRSQNAPSPKPSSTPNPTSASARPDQWPAEQRSRMQELIAKAWREGDYDRAALLQQTYRQLESSSGRLNEEGIGRVRFLVDYFEASDTIAKEKLMTDRLEWIHPVGQTTQYEAVIPLPGTKTEERFTNISTLRIFKALYDQSNLRKKIIAEFEYPEDVRKFFQEERTSTQSTGLENLYKPTLFPKFDSTTTTARLQEQLSLPRKEEAFVAYNEYRILATILLKQYLGGKIAESEVDNLAHSFAGLDEAAQDSFRNYVINNKKIPPDQVYQMLLAIKDVDFANLVESQDPLAVEKLASMLTGNRLVNSLALQDLADQIRNKVRDQAAKEILTDVLKNENPDVPIKRLFQKPIFDLVSRMNEFLGQDKKLFFDAVADPVSLVVIHLARTHVEQTRARTPNEVLDVDTYLQDFRGLPYEDQSGILLQLAISLYQPGGPFSLDPVRLLVSQAMSWSNFAALICASLLCLPILLLGVLGGGFFSRKLVARDRIRELISGEGKGVAGRELPLGRPVELRGRDEVISNLRGLAERGWSTIGVVGRRGVGKSRILYALSREKANDTASPTVKVWVSSPSKFQEEDFIHSIFERLTLSTEAAIASFLGAKPLSIRKIESHSAFVGSVFYAGALVVFVVVVYQMFNRLNRADIVITWLPILALVCTSIWLFFNHISKLQPVDLSTWLQRDRSLNSHTVMLYREVYDVLNFLRRRVRNNSLDGLTWKPGLLKAFGMTALGVMFVASIVVIFTMFDRRLMDVSLLIVPMTIAFSSLILWIYLYRRVDIERSGAYGSSMMSLIADYRSFVTSMVHRLRQGALGHRTEQRFPVLICIDELDKIVDFEEIRAFVRRIKAIFEVPGVYYYVSLAEDTLTALYLGPAEGKNEIDSAFDHIVRIPPLTCDAGEAIALEYLEAHGVSVVIPKLARSISAVSFGIPRDIIRRCDELFALSHGVETSPKGLVAEMRAIQLSLGYELKQLSKAQIDSLSDTCIEAASHARSAVNDGDNQRSEARLLLSIWLLSIVEAAIDRLDGDSWRQITARICDIGYRIPTDPVGDLRIELEEIHGAALGKHP